MRLRNKLQFVLNIFLLIFFLIANSGFARDEIQDVQKFKEYNPDGQKYEFTRTFITALEYLKVNEERISNPTYKIVQDKPKSETIRALNNNLNLDNANIRVSRNLLEKFNSQPNGLILKAVSVFDQACSEQIDINNEERELLDQYAVNYDNERLNEINQIQFNEKFESLSFRRKESSKLILEASFMVGKILISDQLNSQGELDKLGITSDQRTKLISRLNKVYSSKQSRKVKQGQTVLQASVSAIREVLSDENWYTLDK